MTEASKQKVLIIEDNPVNAKLLTLYLQEAGFEVIHAIDGYTGLKTAKTEPDIQVIFLDRIMPDMDGLDLLRNLKLTGVTYDIPVIMLTAALSGKQIEEAKIVGAYACLPKPYNKEKIIAAANDAIKNGRKD